MTEDPAAAAATQTRGPAEHAVRRQIMEAAETYFSHYGYNKTTVADLARCIGFSKAYVYRFFESKQAIGDAICRSRLDGVVAGVRAAMDSGANATERFRRMFKSVTTQTAAMLFNDTKIYEVAVMASLEHWEAARIYETELKSMIEDVVREGRRTGVFECRTSVEETCRSIFYAMTPFVDPIHIKRNLELLPEAQEEVTELILRSLAP